MQACRLQLGKTLKVSQASPRTITNLKCITFGHLKTFRFKSQSCVKSTKRFHKKKNIKLVNLTKDVKNNVSPFCQILKAKVDIIVVFMHYGQERCSGPRPYQHRINKHLMSLGVHMIIGSHPHVLQPHCVTEDNKLIAYSLGNFLFHPNRPVGGNNPVECSFSYQVQF